MAKGEELIANSLGGTDYQFSGYHLQLFAVLPVYQSQGVGALLMKHAENEVRRNAQIVTPLADSGNLLKALKASQGTANFVLETQTERGVSFLLEDMRASNGFFHSKHSTKGSAMK